MMQLKLMHSLTLLFLLNLCVYPFVMGRPSEPQSQDDGNEYYGHLSSETIQKIQKCDMDMDAMELCMRCAKVTKSQIVYPLCCGDEDDIRGWCHRYIYFGQNH